MKQFYLAFPKVNAVRSPLSWPHYRSLPRVDTEEALRQELERERKTIEHHPNHP
jgi:hypothetical protein